jgi:amino acid adenylation domain-containing protein
MDARADAEGVPPSGWWCGPVVAYEYGTLAELLERSFQRFRDWKAVEAADGEGLTYGELEKVSREIASSLRRQYALRSGDRVGVRLPRSVSAITAVVACVRSGWCYVPIESSFPEERATVIAEDAGLKVVLSTEVFAGLLGAQSGAGSGEAPARPTAKAPAYAIYTSGTTGVPKGVVVGNRAAALFIQGLTELFALSPFDRVLQFASLSFDVSVLEVFVALSNGACLVLAGDRERADPAALSDFCHRHRVTVAEIPPALLDRLDPEKFEHLRLLSLGGEKFSMKPVRRWLRPGRRVVNGYGPTEATVMMTAWDCDETTPDDPAIGRPMPNALACVLDDAGMPCRIGEVGELHIGGPILADGYLGRAELTRDKFVTRLGPEGEPVRVYRSGDRVRWTSDGLLEILGRVDEQVQLNGHRVEPGEVECALLRIPAVRQTKVVKADRPGGPMLVAYCVCQPGAAIDVATVRTHLARRLPPYMIPAEVILLDALPLGANGKVDVQRLPAPGSDARATGLNENLAGLLDQVLRRHFGFQPIADDLSLVEAGADSLTLIAVVVQVEEAIGSQIDASAFFSRPTRGKLAELAMQAVEQRDRTEGLLQYLESYLRTLWLQPISTTGKRRLIVFLHCAGGSAHAFDQLGPVFAEQCDVVSVCLPGHDGRRGETAWTSIERLAERIREEVTSLDYPEVYLVGHSMGGLLAYEVARGMDARRLGGLMVVSSRSPDNPPRLRVSDAPDDRTFLMALSAFGGLTRDDFDRLDPDFVAVMRADCMASEGYEAVADPRARLSAPVYVLTGEKDSHREISHAWQAFASNRFVERTADCGHFPMTEAPEAFLALVKEMLAGETAAGAMSKSESE